MSEDRRDRDVEVFALDDDADVPPVRPRPGGRPALSPHAPSGLAQPEPASMVDEVRQGPSDDEPRRIPARLPLGPGRSIAPGALAAAVVGLVVVAFLAGLLTGRSTSPRRPAPTVRTLVVVTQTGEFGSVFPPQPSLTRRASLVIPTPSATSGPTGNVAAAAVYALQLATHPANRKGQSLERRDRGALNGPWSLIVRRDDGSLGRHGSVVTYPLGLAGLSPLPKKRIRVGTTSGYLDVDGSIIWSLAGRYARIRGDLGPATLADIAAGVSAQRGRPALVHPPRRFRVMAFEPYRAPVLAETRYTNSLLLDAGPIDGLVFTDVLRGASFEDDLYSQGSSPAGVIDGRPAVTSSIGGGNATLAWEPTPGTIVFVGYSGGLAASASTATLLDLTRGGRLLDQRQWQATHPSVVNDTNVFS